jgi:membrane protein involved in colicin uptake
MENKVVNLEIKSNIEGSISELKALKRQLRDTAAGSEEFKKLYNQIDDLEDKIKSSKNTSADWIDSLENAGGPLGMLGAGLNRAKVATQSFGGALKATGIGLIVSLLGGLVAAFSENEGAMKKLQPLLDGLKKIFQGVFRAVEPLFDTFVDLATQALPYVTKGIGMVYSAMMAYFTFIKESGGGVMKILKGIFTLDADAITSGIDQVGGSFKKTQTAYSDSMKRFSEGSKELTEKEKEELEKREENRKKALEKQQENERKAKEKREAAEQKAKELKEKKAQEEAAALQKIKDEQLAKEMQSAKDAMAILDNLAKSKETPAEKENREYQEKLAILQANNLSTEELTKQHLETLAGISKTEKEKKDAEDKLFADKEIEREKRVAEEKRNINALAIESSKGLVGILAGLDEENKDLQRGALLANSALSIAEIINNTNVGSSKEVATKGIFGLSTSAVLYAKMAISIGAVIAATAKGLSALGKGGGAPSGGGATGAGGASAAPQFNVVGQGGANQIAQGMAEQNMQPVQAYVVAGAVTTGQALNRNIINNASMG